MGSQPVRTLIMGAAGRDFHNFNTVYRDDPETEVVAFTAAQIPGIAGRLYPPALAGPRYPDGISILDEADLEDICRTERIGRVVFAYSDVPHATVMHAGSRALAAGADFVLLGPARTMLTSKLPVIAISAVRTGCGKSQVGRWLSQRLRTRDLQVGVLRHPMPYGDLEKQAVQRFATREDLTGAECTIEEREEYEPHIEAGGVIYAGVDYARILTAAESEAQVIVWEGGNNDFPFIAPDLHIVLVDALRPDQTTGHHPGETTLRMADVVLVSKSDAAPPENTQKLIATCRDLLGSEVPVIRGGSPVRLYAPDAVAGKNVLIVEDGPTITHGGMPHGAGYAALRGRDDVTIVDPHDSEAPAIARLYEQYPHIGPVLPAVGYGDEQCAALAATINASAADIVVAATPVDLAAILAIDIPVVRARYDYADLEGPGLGGIIDGFLNSRGL